MLYHILYYYYTLSDAKCVLLIAFLLSFFLSFFFILIVWWKYVIYTRIDFPPYFKHPLAKVNVNNVFICAMQSCQRRRANGCDENYFYIDDKCRPSKMSGPVGAQFHDYSLPPYDFKTYRAISNRYSLPSCKTVHLILRNSI